LTLLRASPEAHEQTTELKSESSGSAPYTENVSEIASQKPAWLLALQWSS
jgi:hypothetical protein